MKILKINEFLTSNLSNYIIESYEEVIDKANNPSILPKKQRTNLDNQEKDAERLQVSFDEYLQGGGKGQFATAQYISEVKLRKKLDDGTVNPRLGKVFKIQLIQFQKNVTYKTAISKKIERNEIEQSPNKRNYPNPFEHLEGLEPCIINKTTRKIALPVANPKTIKSKYILFTDEHKFEEISRESIENEIYSKQPSKSHVKNLMLQQLYSITFGRNKVYIASNNNFIYTDIAKSGLLYNPKQL